tara:strand:- start:72 stop:677 length:606 start_codon:yes stop_codon:yes gene_type:complete
MRALIRKYSHGGWHPLKKEEAYPTVSKMSDREEDIYGSVSQQLGGAVTSSGGDKSDILKMLALSPQQSEGLEGMDWSVGEKLPKFRASRDKKGNTRFWSLDEESQQYNAGDLDDNQLAQMFGRELTPSEEKYVRGNVFRDPALLSYFMEIGEAPSKKEMYKYKTVNVGQKESSGGSSDDSNCVGEGCPDVISGKAISWKDY